ncbi:MAG: thiamine pyrophosphate-dependent enzyme [Candidatus Latescibacterota bacterium]|nr:thiamine pyrophosphate-dependent enzyme [Candidatus Latescibacterota bacterium]
MIGVKSVLSAQGRRNRKLLKEAKYLGNKIDSEVLPLRLDLTSGAPLAADERNGLEALQIEAARTAIRSLASLATIGELDHLGGGLDLIPALTTTLAVTDYERVEFTIEHAHTSIGYYSTLSAYGFVESEDVVHGFRRGLDIPGHVSWLPGGTQLNGGRLGVMIPVAVGQALGKKAKLGEGSWVICHCGDAGWVSGQALNGFNGADVHGAPISFVMHRNGIQLSGATRSIMDKDPRSVITALGIELIEIPSLHETEVLWEAYREAYCLAQNGRPSLIYPTGYRSQGEEIVNLRWFAELYGIVADTEQFAAAHGVSMNRPIWVPGALMSFRDVGPMLECLFLVNDLPGGEGHHDGHMKGRDEAEVLANPMVTANAQQVAVLQSLRRQSPRQVTTAARPQPGSPNLILPTAARTSVNLPGPGESVSARNGSEAGYAALASAFADQLFIVSCDLDVSTKLGKASAQLADDHRFEMSIEEQVATLMADGLAMAGAGPQLNLVSTFAAFYEGIAREGFDLWRYQRNLNGVNEGLNVAFHVSHVGACTGRDHFSGWGLDWINVGLTYLPYLHRFYAPADARAAFVAVVDLAAHYGGHIIGIPRDNLPILEKQDGSGPLWETTSTWEPVTQLRRYEGAERAILAFGASAFLAAEAADKLTKKGVASDAHVISGLPLSDVELERLLAPYPAGVVTVEDGFIGNAEAGIRGFAGLVANKASDASLPIGHVGITDPTTAPSDGHMGTWKHFGITAGALVKAVEEL